jgi:hypothetical protein
VDRLPSNRLEMTEELIANMLGVPGEGVAAAADMLQAQGLIQYNRGAITVLDRARLEQRVCECYAVVKREFERLLHLPGRAEAPWMRSSPNGRHSRARCFLPPPR